jgi:hypothetical protein
MFTEPYLQGRMNLDGLVSKENLTARDKRRLRDAQGRLGDPVVLRSEREFLSKETSDERYDEQRRDQDDRDALH